MARDKQWTDAEVEAVVDKPDITYVKNKDNSRYYRFAERDPLRIEELKNEGYRIEAEDDEARPSSPIAIEDDASSKVTNIPGMVLVSRPKELHEKILEKRKGRFEHIAKREEEAAMEDIKRAFDKVGMPTKLRRRLRDAKRIESVDRNF